MRLVAVGGVGSGLDDAFRDERPPSAPPALGVKDGGSFGTAFGSDPTPMLVGKLAPRRPNPFIADMFSNSKKDKANIRSLRMGGSCHNPIHTRIDGAMTTDTFKQYSCHAAHYEQHARR